MDAESTTGQQSVSDHQLAVEIERLVLDADLRATIGAAAAHRARQEFSIQRHVDELMTMYDQVLARR